MRIALIMPLANQIGGAEKLFVEYLKFNPRKKDFIVIFLTNGPLAKEMEKIGFEVKIIEAGRLRQLPNFIKTIYQISRLVKEKNINLIFSWMSKAHLYGGLAAYNTKLPSAWFNHEISEKSFLRTITTLIPSKLIFCCSKTGKEAQEKIWPRRAVKCIYPGIDFEEFKNSGLTKENLRKKLLLPTDKILIGSFGRLQGLKSQHILIQAIPTVVKIFPNIKVYIVGSKQPHKFYYEDFLKNEIRRLNLEDTVTLSGYQKNVPLWMEAMDLVVHTAKDETFGLVVVEAMALGKPIIVCNSGGPKEIVKSEENGLFSKFNDPYDLADKIIKILDNPTLSKKISKNAIIRAKEFNINNFVLNLNKELFDE